MKTHQPLAAKPYQALLALRTAGVVKNHPCPEPHCTHASLPLHPSTLSMVY